MGNSSSVNLTTSSLCVKLPGDLQLLVFLLWSENHLVCDSTADARATPWPAESEFVGLGPGPCILIPWKFESPWPALEKSSSWTWHGPPGSHVLSCSCMFCTLNQMAIKPLAFSYTRIYYCAWCLWCIQYSGSICLDSTPFTNWLISTNLYKIFSSHCIFQEAFTCIIF